MEKLIIVILIIFIIILLSRIRIVISKEENQKITTTLYIFPKLGIKINIDKFFKKYNTILSKNILKDLQLILNIKQVIFDFIKILKIRKINIEISYNYLSFPNIYIYFILWNTLSITKYYLDNNVRCVGEENYIVNISNNKNNVKVYIDIIFPLIFLIFVLIKNINVIMKGIIKYGSSN